MSVHPWNCLLHVERGSGRHACRANGWQGLKPWLANLGRFVHQPENIKRASAEYREVDENKGCKRRRNGGKRERRCRVCREKRVVDHIRLAADFGCYPSGQHSGETGRSHENSRTLQPAIMIKTPAQPAVKAPEPKPYHQEADAH